MNNPIRLIIAIGLPIGILALLFIAVLPMMSAMRPQADKADEAPRALAVFTAPVERTSIQLTVESTGEVRPRREIALAPQISGRVAFVSDSFLDGGFVARGEILVKVEDADYQLDKIRAQSQVASAEQALVREQAQATIARQDWEELGTGTPSPLALREPQLAEAQAALDAAKAQLQDAELALERTVIRAPFDGRVRSREVDLGQFVSPGQNLGRVFGTDIAEISLPLTDAELGRLGLSLAFEETPDEPGPAVKLSTSVAGIYRNWSGRITRTAASIDPQTRLVSVIATVNDPFGKGADGDAPLAPGLFVTAEIQGAELEGVLKAPRSALRDGRYLYCAEPEESVMHINEIDVVFTDPTGVYFRSGANLGDLAITSPIQAAFDGMSITIADQK